MWYVEAVIGDQTERWEGLTEDQSIAVQMQYVASGNLGAIYGPMVSPSESD
jgi:hypothetical protein|tara:strand:+ start:697 stop:849 length:153 start_codon:yes stop_codon:yes gene_type:complete